MGHIGNQLNYEFMDSIRFDYLGTDIPTKFLNPPRPYMNYLNTLTGEVFFCSDNSIDSNVWKGQLGTEVLP